MSKTVSANNQSRELFKYRPELDGLRAVAVVSVVLCHARTPGFQGGFIGVDIFFVLSGYLITAIILKDLRKGSFSIANFYERRSRRILPALYFVIACTLPVFCLMMMPSQLKAYSQSLVAVSAFGANVYFYLKSGYFDPAAERSPLLHTWSLAVEEQFYFVFPVFLTVAYRFFRKATVQTILILAAVSLWWAQSLLQTDASQSFYLPFGRAWELMVGSILNFLPERPRSKTMQWEIASLSGIVLIVMSIVFLNEHSPFPGLAAVPPTLGAAIVIYCCSDSGYTGKILGSRPFVGIGLISYSIYLWHHPLFAIARLSTIGEPSPAVLLGLAVLSVALGYLSWRFVERPFRNPAEVSTRKLLSICCVGVLATIGIGLTGHSTNGFAEIKYQQAGSQFRQFDERLAALRLERGKYWAEILPEGRTQFTKRVENRRVMIVGDSRAEDLFVSLWSNRERFENTEFRYQRLDDLCFSTLHDPLALSVGACGTEATAFLDRLKLEQADLYLISCGWQRGSDDALVDLMQILPASKCIVFGTASFNEIESQFYQISARAIPKPDWPVFFTQNVHTSSLNASLQVKKISQEQGFRFIDSYQAFCDGDPSNSQKLYHLTTETDEPLLIDQTHLTVEAAKRFGRVILDRGWLEPASK